MATIIRCQATDCIFNEAGVCTAQRINVSPNQEDSGPVCLTYRTAGEIEDRNEEAVEQHTPGTVEEVVPARLDVGMVELPPMPPRRGRMM